jgi:exosortase/archaeosortase family protein
MAASLSAVLPTSSSARQAWRFGLLCGAFIALWLVGSAYGLGDDSALDTILCNQLATASAWGLRAIGWVATTDTVQPSLLLLNGQPSVIVGAPCDGLVLYALLAGFVLAYPGPAQRRLWFIPLGIAALWLLNIIRIIALALNHQYSPETFEFDHHYAFNVVAYAALGGLWLLWTRQAGWAAAPETGWPAASVASAASTPARQPWLSAGALAGAAVLLVLICISISQNQVTAALSAGWAQLLATGPAWLHRLPGATAGSAAVPGNVSHLALPVGAAYIGLFVGLALLALRLLLPSRHWLLVWRCYACLGLVSVLLIGAGRVGNSAESYRIGRLVLDFMVSLLPVMGLLVLLWRGKAATPTPALPASEPLA